MSLNPPDRQSRSLGLSLPQSKGKLMSTQNIQNNIPLQPVQNNIPVQALPVCAPTQYIQGKPPIYQPVQNYNYIPRYMPLVQNGQVYPVSVPSQMQESSRNASVGAVNITINGVNPTVQSPAAPQPVSVMPYYPPANNTVQDTKKEVIESKKEVLPAPAPEKKPEETKNELKNNKKPAVELTDIYIQQLEKKLNNKDKNERAHAVAELVNRFKEDETRKDDPRLTNLLNMALQDSSKPIVLAAMQSIENGYANGNQVTEQRLQTIRDAKDTFGNSETAEGLLAKISAKQPGVKTVNETPGQKLNLVSK